MARTGELMLLLAEALQAIAQVIGQHTRCS